MQTVQEGEPAPDFSAKDSNGEPVNLSDFDGQRLVLYFYPKDDTPGCTKQACSLRDSFAVFEEKNIKILGVSTDDEKSHQKFVNKYNLPFTLLADTNHELSDIYGVYGEKSMYGKKYMGITRTTFLIDENKKVVRIFRKVKVEQHAQEVLEAFGV
ncbi:MAG: thioredoxin-dependent thiol peroxidase [Pyrinomonadaceae bacterium]|nr:thioredoxin-dependent thiol peroxidase [Pyrinomonadaceae bacterium]